MIESRIHRVVSESVGGSSLQQEVILRRRMQELTESSLGFPRGAVVVSRRVVCGRAWPDLRARAHRPALGQVPSHGDVVWFLDETEYLACLLGAAARNQLDGWWWRLAVGAIPTPVVVARLLHERGPVAREAVVRVVKAGLGPALARWMGAVDLPRFPARQARVVVEAGRRSSTPEGLSSRPTPGGDAQPAAEVVDDSMVPGPILLEGVARQVVSDRKPDTALERLDPPGIDATEYDQEPASTVSEGVEPASRAQSPVPPPVRSAVDGGRSGEKPPVPDRSGAAARSEHARFTGSISDHSPGKRCGREPKNEGAEVEPTPGPGPRESWGPSGIEETEYVASFASRPPKAFSTEFGGHLFVLNALIAHGWFPDFTRPLDVGMVPSPWIALGMLGRRWFGKRFQADRLSRWLEDRDGACGFAESSVEKEVRILEARIASGLGTPLRRALALLCHRRAVVLDDGNRLVARFALESHPLAIRLAGLDRDPGWMETGGRDVRFDFSVAGDA